MSLKDCAATSLILKITINSTVCKRKNACTNNSKTLATAWTISSANMAATTLTSIHRLAHLHWYIWRRVWPKNSVTSFFETNLDSAYCIILAASVFGHFVINKLYHSIPHCHAGSSLRLTVCEVTGYMSALPLIHIDVPFNSGVTYLWCEGIMAQTVRFSRMTQDSVYPILFGPSLI